MQINERNTQEIYENNKDISIKLHSLMKICQTTFIDGKFLTMPCLLT